MNQNNITKFCLLKEEASLLDILKSLSISSNQIKKYLKKNILNKIFIQRDEISIPISLLNQNMISPFFSGKIDVLFEDDRYIVISKPYQLHCHPQDYECSSNCLSFLRKNNMFDALEVNGEFYDRGLLYRLDYETSGVLFLTKDNEIYKSVRENSSESIKHKRYIAICSGKFNNNGKHSHKLISSGQKGKIIKIGQEGRDCHADFKLVNYNSDKDCSLVEIKLETGHRHQIRVQLKELGFPILGDDLYGGAKSSRMFLHAFEYTHNDLCVTDTSAELFREFFDLDRLLK